MRIRFAALLLAPMLLGAAPLQDTQTADDVEEVVITGSLTPEEIVITGLPRRCARRLGDPDDAVFAPTDRAGLTLQPDADGQMRYLPSRPHPLLWFSGAEHWQRAAANPGNFVFRVPTDGNPLCIGKRRAGLPGTAQLLRVQLPDRFRCRFLRFTSFVATRKAVGRIWLNAGKKGKHAFVDTYITGTRRWTPVQLQAGPVDFTSDWVGYGVLAEQGDVWFVQPRFEIIPDAELPGAQRRMAGKCWRDEWSRQANERLTRNKDHFK